MQVFKPKNNATLAGGIFTCLINKMKKYLFLVLFLSSYAFSTLPPGSTIAACGAYGQIMYYDDTSQNNNAAINSFTCPSGQYKGSKPEGSATLAVCWKSCSCPAGTSIGSAKTSENLGDLGGRWQAVCVPNSSSSSSVSSSSSSSSVAACPSGKTRDSNGTCSTCAGGQVLNISNNTCENKASCTYPQRYGSYNNSCGDNPDRCALNTYYNPITEESCATSPVQPAPTCPSGWTLLPNNTCIESATSSQAAASSSGANSSSGNNTSSGNNSSVASSSPKLPTDPGDNTDQNQSTASSQSIPANTSNAECVANYSASACTALQNCKLTFGVDRCVGVTENITCPNSYVINGQKICVLPSSGSNSSSGASSGSGSSKGAGECDPESHGYLQCQQITGIKIPTEKGHFDDQKLQQEVQSAQDELKAKIDTVKQELNSTIALHLNSGGSFEDNCTTIRGAEVCFGFARFASHITMIPAAIIVLAYVLALFIVLRRD